MVALGMLLVDGAGDAEVDAAIGKRRIETAIERNGNALALERLGQLRRRGAEGEAQDIERGRRLITQAQRESGGTEG